MMIRNRASHLVTQCYARAVTTRRPSMLKFNTFLALTSRLDAASSFAPALSLLSSFARMTAQGYKRRLTLRVLSAGAD